MLHVCARLCGTGVCGLNEFGGQELFRDMWVRESRFRKVRYFEQSELVKQLRSLLTLVRSLLTLVRSSYFEQSELVKQLGSL